MRYWWVNQNKTFHHEIRGGYLWSPKRKKDGSRNHFYNTMREVAPGDIVLSFQKTYLRSFGVVQSYCYESPLPVEFGTDGVDWLHVDVGWRVDVGWTPLEQQIRPADHIGEIRPLLPQKYSPLRSNGHGLQSVYLTEIPSPMMQALARLIGYELLTTLSQPEPPLPDRIGERPDTVHKLKEDWEDTIERQIDSDQTINNTERIALIRARRGQGKYRSRVRQIERACRVTRVDNPEHLIASHCKPWRHCTNDERVDGENGLLLTPSIDHLFDRGFISFEDGGRLLLSPVADRLSLQRMGVEPEQPVNVGGFSEGQRQYLDYHRNEIFLEM